MVYCLIKQRDSCISSFKTAVMCSWNEYQLASVVRVGVMNDGSNQAYSFINILMKFYTFCYWLDIFCSHFLFPETLLLSCMQVSCFNIFVLFLILVLSV